MVGLNFLGHVHYPFGHLPQVLAVRHHIRRYGNARFGVAPGHEDFVQRVVKKMNFPQFAAQKGPAPLEKPQGLP